MFAVLTVTSLYLCAKCRLFVAPGPVRSARVGIVGRAGAAGAAPPGPGRSWARAAGGGGALSSECRSPLFGAAPIPLRRQPRRSGPLNPPKPHPLPPAPQGHFAKAVLCLLPLGLAAFITMSRVAGYKHDFSDVNAGA